MRSEQWESRMGLSGLMVYVGAAAFQQLPKYNRPLSYLAGKVTIQVYALPETPIATHKLKILGAVATFCSRSYTVVVFLLKKKPSTKPLPLFNLLTGFFPSLLNGLWLCIDMRMSNFSYPVFVRVKRITREVCLVKSSLIRWLFPPLICKAGLEVEIRPRSSAHTLLKMIHRSGSITGGFNQRRLKSG